MSFEEALEAASRDAKFRATVYAINTLLIQKAVYTQQEFEALFVEWVSKELRRTPTEKHAESVAPVLA